MIRIKNRSTGSSFENCKPWNMRHMKYNSLLKKNEIHTNQTKTKGNRVKRINIERSATNEHRQPKQIFSHFFTISEEYGI